MPQHRLYQTSTKGRSTAYGRLTDESMEALIGRHIVPQPNGCWLWKGRSDDYAYVTVRGSTFLVHRFVFETFFGPIDKGLEVHHTCVTPGCCNPSHLKTLTNTEHKAAHREMRNAG